LKEAQTKPNSLKVGIGGYLWLLLAILAFSGIFMNMKGPLNVLDFNCWVGQFGKIVDAAAPGFMGKGGTGVSNGFLQALSIAPGVFMAVTFMTLVEHYRGLAAAQKLLSPLLRPLLGISGACGLSLISNLQSSDTSAALAKSALDSGLITPRDRDILITTEFIGAALIGRLFSNGAVLFPYLVVSPGVIMLVVLVAKFIGGNLMRLYIRFEAKNTPKEEVAV